MRLNPVDQPDVRLRTDGPRLHDQEHVNRLPGLNGDERHQSRYSPQNLLVLMDSNRRNIDFSQLFPEMNVNVVACGNMEYASRFVQNDQVNHPDVVLVHLGTNDLKFLSPNELVDDMIKFVYLVEDTYPGASVRVSQIPPRRDENKKKVVPTNEMLVSSGLPTFDHRLLVEDHLHDEVHVGLFPVNGLSGVQVLARDLYVGVYDEEPSRDHLNWVVSHNPKGKGSNNRRKHSPVRDRFRYHGH